MSMHFSILASGSLGNAAYLAADGFGLLIDLGLGPRQLEDRMAKIGVTWAQVRAVVLSHTHGDHWNDRSFGQLGKNRIPLYCHLQHHQVLTRDSEGFRALAAENLVMAYKPGEVFHLTPRFACLPFRVHHDSGLTCGFRLEGPPDMFGEPVAFAYASDLGTWDGQLAELMSDVDALAVEFNHDVTLQKNSRRSRRLIARNLGNKGHLSNNQAAALVGEVLRQTAPGRLRHVVQLHLSRECNQPELARGSLQDVLAGASSPIELHTAMQDSPTALLRIGDERRNRPASRPRTIRILERKCLQEAEYIQPMLPGWEE